jgi:Domain of unknown function (DUF4397)
MTFSFRIASVLLSALVFAACGRDAQTEEDVTTKTSAGEAATSMSGDSADKRGQALVRVVNAVPNVTGLSVRSDDAHTLPAVDYQRVSAYQPIDKNWVTFQISGAPDGSYAPVEVNREMLTDGHRYTLVVMREAEGSGFETRVLRDEISDDPTKAQLRVIHAAKGAGEVDVVAPGGDTFFDDVDYSSEAGYKAIDPWKGALELRSEDGKRRLLSLPSIDYKGGSSYTIVVTRNTAGKLQAFWFQDTQN